MVFSNKDAILNKTLYLSKGYGSHKLMSECPDKGCKRSLDKLLRKVHNSGSVERQKGSGTPRSACTVENINTVIGLVLSQESTPKTHHSTVLIFLVSGVMADVF